MSTPVPGTLDFQVANENAYQASVGAMSEAERIAKLALAVQQISGGLRRALQAIYDEVD
jgi:hypothetical protein